MVSRVDALLGELRSRHGTELQFMEQLRPMVEDILDDGTPEHLRPQLLELLAETCDRHIEIQRNTEAMRRALKDFFASIAQVVGKLAVDAAGDHPFGKPAEGDGPRDGDGNDVSRN